MFYYTMGIFVCSDGIRHCLALGMPKLLVCFLNSTRDNLVIMLKNLALSLSEIACRKY